MSINISIYVEILKDNNWELLEEKNSNFDSELLSNFHEYYDPEFYNDLEFLNEQKEYIPFNFYKTFDSQLYNNVENLYRRMEELQHISEPKGVPDNISQQLKPLIKNNTYGHNWLTLNELLNFNWQKKLRRTAKVKQDLAPLFAAGKEFPLEDWPEGEKYYPIAKNFDGATVSWLESYEESPSKKYLEETLENLKNVGNPNHIRILFWFSE